MSGSVCARKRPSRGRPVSLRSSCHVLVPFARDCLALCAQHLISRLSATASPQGEASCALPSSKYISCLPLEGKVAVRPDEVERPSPASRRDRIRAVTPAKENPPSIPKMGVERAESPSRGSSRGRAPWAGVQRAAPSGGIVKGRALNRCWLCRPCTCAGPRGCARCRRPGGCFPGRR